MQYSILEIFFCLKKQIEFFLFKAVMKENLILGADILVQTVIRHYSVFSIQ